MLSNLRESSIALTIVTAISAATIPAQAALLVGSNGDNSIKQYDETTGAYIRDFVTSGSGGLSNPQGLALGLNGNLFVSSRSTNSIKEYSGSTGDYIGDFATATSGLLSPQGLTFGIDGSLFVVSSNIPGSDIPGVPGGRRSGVLQYDTTTGDLLNTISTGVSSSTISGPQPVDVAIGGPDNNLFISSSSARFNSGRISEYEPTTGEFVRGLPRQVSFLSPRGIAATGSNIFYTDFSTVGRIDLVTGTANTSFINSGSGGLSSPIDIAIGANGNLFISDSASDSVKQYDGATGNFLGDFVTSGSGGLGRPTYLTTANVPVPEPSSVLGIAAFGGLFVGGALQRKANRRKQLNLLQK